MTAIIAEQLLRQRGKAVECVFYTKIHKLHFLMEFLTPLKKF